MIGQPRNRRECITALLLALDEMLEAMDCSEGAMAALDEASDRLGEDPAYTELRTIFRGLSSYQTGVSDLVDETYNLLRDMRSGDV